MEVLTAVAAWAITSACLSVPVARQLLGGICQRDTAELGNRLSANAKIYQPGSAEFDAASIRWSNLKAPTVNLVVVPATENDVAEAVSSQTLSHIQVLVFLSTDGPWLRSNTQTRRICLSLRTMAFTEPSPHSVE